MKINKEVIAYILMLFLLCVLCPHDQFVSDARAWSDWSIYMLHNGYAHAYDCNTTPVNYNPFYLIVLRLYAGLMGNDDAIQSHIFMLKFFTLFVEWAGVIYLCYTISDKNNRLTNFLFCFLNIGFLYNTLIWGQIDGMLSAFIICSIVLLYRGNLVLSLLLFILALNTKLVAIFYLPVWGLLFIQQFRNTPYRKMISAFIAGVSLQVLILLPFIRAGNLYQAFAVNFHAVGYYKYISLAAYNFWHLIWPGKLDKATDMATWGPWTYRQWGFLLFYISAFIALLPLLRDTWRSLKQKAIRTSVATLLLCGGLLCLCFFYFSTEMHERYSHTSLWFFAGYAFVSRRWAPFILSSIAVFLNMAMACSEVFALQYKLISVIFALAMVIAFADLYRASADRGDYAD
ncbi:MAG: hypothetical protein JWO03_3519 [Bacteroidetes bacterium]|nr:hypothetical protein [Bacteroidota bacterium]